MPGVNVIFKDTLPAESDYRDLFITTGWNEKYHFSVHDLAEAIRNSWYSCSLYESDKLIGFGRVISDGKHHAFIVDLIVHPDFQGKGFGSMLLEKLVSRCREHKIRDIQLFAARGKFAFYERHGFEKRPADAPGMQLRNL